MPAIETDCLTQEAVLLAKTGHDLYGKATVAAAVEIKVRWESKEEMVPTPDGSVVSLMATVVVDRAIEKGSVMWLGKLINFSSPYTNLHEVWASKSVPDIKGRVSRRVVQLIRFTDKLPATT